MPSAMPKGLLENFAPTPKLLPDRQALHRGTGFPATARAYRPVPPVLRPTILPSNRNIADESMRSLPSISRVERFVQAGSISLTARSVERSFRQRLVPDNRQPAAGVF